MPPKQFMIEVEWTNIMLSGFGWPGNYNLPILFLV
jgi:hypothetical protein